MPRLTFLLATLLLSSSVAAAEIAPATYEAAMRAYQAKDYATCSTILVDLSKTSGPRTSVIAYNAACCLALSGRTDDAFKSLELAITTDLVGAKEIEADADLQSLRTDKAWSPFIARAAQLEESRMAGINRELRDKLLAREEKDQIARNKLTGTHQQDPALIEEVTRIDRDNTAWMKQVLASHGWPGKSLVLKDGASAAWLLVQHADRDRAFQKQALESLKAAVAKGEADGGSLAYLTDRVLVGEGKPQLYGTQFHTVNGLLVPQPIEDEANVDSRRAAVGLSSLAEYKSLMQGQYGPKTK